MTKININATLVLVIMVFLIQSCTKEYAVDTRVKLTSSSQEVEINKQVIFYVNGNGEFLTFFTGRPGQEFDSMPTSNGMPDINNGDSIFVRYSQAGSYKAVLLGRSFGQWGEEMAEDIDSIRIEVQDTETGISQARIMRPKRVKGQIEDDVIRFASGDMELTEVQMQIFTISNAAKIYPNSDTDNVVEGGARFYADFSGPNPHILVESFSGTTQKYTLIFE
jgi:hypothetical protein